MDTKSQPGQRIDGLDLARLLALLGMIQVNLQLVMLPLANTIQAAGGFLQGKAAALFVVLAGVGLGLMAQTRKRWSFATETFRRACILLLIGLLNLMIFPADIIHYYAFYFMLVIPLAGLSSRWLAGILVAVTLAWPVAFMLLDYSRGWDWSTLTYHALWTPSGIFTACAVQWLASGFSLVQFYSVWPDAQPSGITTAQNTVADVNRRIDHMGHAATPAESDFPG